VLLSIALFSLAGFVITQTNGAANAAHGTGHFVFILIGFFAAVLLGAVFRLFAKVRARSEAIARHEASIEERFRDLYENASDIIYTHDLSGRITSMSNAGLTALGYSSQEMLGMNVSEIMDPADIEIARTETKKKLDGAPRSAYELRLRGRDGRYVYIEVNSRIIFKDGVAVGVQGIARDITQRKSAEAALRVSERQLRASLEERERLGRDLHDGIIQSIYAAGLHLEDTLHVIRQDPAAAEDRIRKSTADLNQIIREVRGFIVGLERHRLKGEEFKAALRALTLMAGENKSSQINLTIDETAAAELSGDEATQLLQIAREALSNSIRHGKASRLLFALGRSEHGVIFQISDDGIGFDSNAIGEKGYGLRNMAARAEEIHANFKVDSKLGKGTTIVLDIRRPNPENSRL
jgi:PAS domain S-box-containing protein